MRLILVLCILVLAFPTPESSAQSRRSPVAEPVRLAEIVKPDSLTVGDIAHFRARVADRSAQPASYLWDMGDGRQSVGALVSHVYTSPGTYAVSVVARNATHAHTLRIEVQVTQVPSAPIAIMSATVEPRYTKPESLDEPIPARTNRFAVPPKPPFGSGGVSPENGDYTWVVGTDLWAERAQDRMRAYRLQGFRAGIHVDTAGRGSPAYRLVLGQFASEREAHAARPWLPRDAKGTWLLKLSPAPGGGPA